MTRVRSPLQKELDSLTKVLGVIAWTAVAFIVVVGLLRGPRRSTTWCCSARRWRSPRSRPACRRSSPACCRSAPSSSPRRKAVVKNLTDVETLGATSAINTDKTGTLTMNEMMVSTIYAGGSWFTVNGQGYGKTGSDRVRRRARRCPTSRAWPSAWRSTATRPSSDDGTVIGDPTEAALVVLAAKLGVSAEETRRAYPRLAEVPFDSDYKFMATFHRVTVDGAEHVIELVKGGADVVFARCSARRRPAERLAGPDRRRAGRSRRRQRAHGRAGPARARVRGSPRRPTTSWTTMADDPMALTQDLAFVGMAGMIDPLRAEAKDAVDDRARGRHRRADDHRRQPDHRQRDRRRRSASGPGRSAAPSSRRCPTRRSCARLPQLHVFGRVTPEDKLRLARADAGARARSSRRPATPSTTPPRSSRPTSASRWAAAAR